MRESAPAIAPVRKPKAPDRRRTDKRAAVPSRYVQALLRHEPDPQRTLFEFYESEYGDLQTRPQDPKRILDYQNTWSGHEIELINAAFHRAEPVNDLPGRVAEFRSLGEWVGLASGKAPKRAAKYYAAIETLQAPHWILDKDRGRVILSRTAPVKITERNTDEGSAIRVEIAEELRQNPDSFHRVDLAIGERLRRAGLPRVQTCHVKLYLYVLVRLKAKHKRASLTNIFRATGLAHYFAQRNGKRAQRLIESGLNALRKAGVIGKWRRLGGGLIEFEGIVKAL